jgi:hypothetical protein
MLYGLAKSLEGKAAFARVLVDSSEELEGLAGDLALQYLPTLVFYRNRREVGRLVSSDRNEILGHVMKYLEEGSAVRLEREERHLKLQEQQQQQQQGVGKGLRVKRKGRKGKGKRRVARS